MYNLVEVLCINTMQQGGEKSKASGLLTHSGSSTYSPLGMSLIGGANTHFKIPGLYDSSYLILGAQSATESPKYEIFSWMWVGHFTCRAGLRCALMKPLVSGVTEVTAPRKRCLSEAAETFGGLLLVGCQDWAATLPQSWTLLMQAAGSDIVLEHMSCVTDHTGHNGGGWQDCDLQLRPSTHLHSVCPSSWQWRHCLHIIKPVISKLVGSKAKKYIYLWHSFIYILNCHIF